MKFLEFNTFFFALLTFAYFGFASHVHVTMSVVGFQVAFSQLLTFLNSKVGGKSFDTGPLLHRSMEHLV